MEIKIKYKSILQKVVKTAIILSSFVYIFSGVLKIFNPDSVFNSINIMTEEFFGFEFSYVILLYSVLFISAWEILISLLYIVNIYRKYTLPLLFTTNLFITIVAFALNHLNSLVECGCIGDLSENFTEIHLPFLIVFNLLLIIEMFYNYENNKLAEMSKIT